MNRLQKKPYAFFISAIAILIVVSFLDRGLFHFFVDMFTVFIGLTIYVVVLNSQVYAKKSALLVISVIYLYVACLDLAHVLTFFNVSNIGVSLNQSYLLFTSARVYEVASLAFLFLVVCKTRKPNYLATQIAGSTIFVLIMVLILSGNAGDFYIDGEGFTLYAQIVHYLSGALYLLVALLIYKSNLKLKYRNLLVAVFIVKAISQLIFVFPWGGESIETISMLLRFLSYGGLYVVFIREVVQDPYSNVYAIFETKEKELLTLSERDSLTGIYNHSLTFKNIEKMIQQIGTKYKELCVILFDIDNFKQINDSFGHIKGDEMLVTFTSILENIQYKERMVGRYGGDEFVLALPDCKEHNIEVLFEYINKALEKVAIENGVHITFSAGVVLWHMGDNATDLIRKADIKMYESKNKGKNQYAIWQQSYKQK